MDPSKISANVSCMVNRSLRDAISAIRRIGFSSIGLLAFDGAKNSSGYLPGFWFDDLTEEGREDLKGWLKGFEHISIQAPSDDLPLFTYNVRVKEEAINQIREAMEAAWFFGAEVVTVRANPKPFFDISEYWEEMVQTFRLLGDFASGCGVKLGIETGFPDTFERYTNLFLEIDHDSVGATLDVGRILPYVPREALSSPEGDRAFNRILMRMAMMLGSKIHLVHLHDVRGEDWRCGLPLTRGIVEFEPLFEFLGDMGYDGLLELELEADSPEEGLVESRYYVEDMIAKYG